MIEKIDLDHNGGVSKEELDHAIKRGQSKLFKIFGYLQGSRLIMQQCDYDKNGEITARDMKMSAARCFHNDLLRCGMKHACAKRKLK